MIHVGAEAEKNTKDVIIQIEMSEIFQRVAFHALINNNKHEFLVLHRVSTDDHSPDVWDLPGGSSELGETDPDKTLTREVKEETGLDINIIKPIFVFSRMSGPARHQFQIVYKCQYCAGELKLNPEEHDEYRWIKRKDLDSLPLIQFLQALNEKVLKK